MYLKIHPFERPEHGLKHFEDEVGPIEDRIEHQEHSLDHGSGDDLEDGAESRVGSRVENLETFCGIFSNRTFSGA